jgi:hypothetical protein
MDHCSFYILDIHTLGGWSAWVKSSRLFVMYPKKGINGSPFADHDLHCVTLPGSKKTGIKVTRSGIEH